MSRPKGGCNESHCHRPGLWCRGSHYLSLDAPGVSGHVGEAQLDSENLSATTPTSALWLFASATLRSVYKRVRPLPPRSTRPSGRHLSVPARWSRLLHSSRIQIAKGKWRSGPRPRVAFTTTVASCAVGHTASGKKEGWVSRATCNSGARSHGYGRLPLRELPTLVDSFGNRIPTAGPRNVD